MDIKIVVCVKERFSDRPSCAQRGSVPLADSLESALAAQGLEIPVERILCFGRCHEGPNMRISPGGAFFTGMTQERLDEVVQAARSARAAALETPAVSS
ncbi:MAG: (2Fe-2S) ferredoxin domain-containing protein [Magnetococcales bacterium]|nr:(2Fe-2S) ferredoxin domain-containing protein [Magnetococcales bacterium]